MAKKFKITPTVILVAIIAGYLVYTFIIKREGLTSNIPTFRVNKITHSDTGFDVNLDIPDKGNFTGYKYQFVLNYSCAGMDGAGIQFPKSEKLSIDTTSTRVPYAPSFVCSSPYPYRLDIDVYDANDNMITTTMVSIF